MITAPKHDGGHVGTMRCESEQRVDLARDELSVPCDLVGGPQHKRMNEVMKTMTGWGSILLGATLIAGIYGMNFTHMPELSWYFGYPSAIAMMLILTFVLFTFLRRKDWL